MVISPLVTKFREGGKRVVPPVASFLILLIFWQVFVQVFNVPIYLLPTPMNVLASFIQQSGLLLSNARTSIYEAVMGFLLSIPTGIFLAVLVVWSRNLDRTVTPFLIFSQAVPKIAIAPLLLVWFGFGMVSKLMIVFLMAFFPIFLSTLSGLRAVDPDLLNMTHCMGPTKLQVFTKLRIPNSLPFLLDGLKLAIVRSVISAVVAEWISSDRGLGYLVIYADAANNAPLLFATIALLSAIGFGLFIIVSVLGRFMVPWYFEMRKTEFIKEKKY